MVTCLFHNSANTMHIYIYKLMFYPSYELSKNEVITCLRFKATFGKVD